MTHSPIDKNVIYGLYCLCHPEDGIRYVGQTSKGAASRLENHRATTKHKVKHGKKLYYINNWIIKHGYDNIQSAVLEICFVDELDEAEARWISTLDPDINIRPGGLSTRGWKMPPERVEAMRGEGNPMFGVDRSELMAYARQFKGPMSAQERQNRADRLAESRKDSEWEAKRIEGVRRSRLDPEFRKGLRDRVLGEKNPRYGVRATEEEKRQMSMARTPMTEDDIIRIRALRESGLKYTEIEALMPSHVTLNMVGKVCRGAFDWVQGKLEEN